MVRLQSGDQTAMRSRVGRLVDSGLSTRLLIVVWSPD